MDSIETVSGLSQSSRRQRTQLLLAAATGYLARALCWRRLTLVFPVSLPVALPGVPVYSVVSGQARI